MVSTPCRRARTGAGLSGAGEPSRVRSRRTTRAGPSSSLAAQNDTGDPVSTSPGSGPAGAAKLDQQLAGRGPRQGDGLGVDGAAGLVAAGGARPARSAVASPVRDGAGPFEGPAYDVRRLPPAARHFSASFFFIRASRASKDSLAITLLNSAR